MVGEVNEELVGGRVKCSIVDDEDPPKNIKRWFSILSPLEEYESRIPVDDCFYLRGFLLT